MIIMVSLLLAVLACPCYWRQWLSGVVAVNLSWLGFWLLSKLFPKQLGTLVSRLLRDKTQIWFPAVGREQWPSKLLQLVQWIGRWLLPQYLHNWMCTQFQFAVPQPVILGSIGYLDSDRVSLKLVIQLLVRDKLWDLLSNLNWPVEHSTMMAGVLDLLDLDSIRTNR